MRPISVALAAILALAPAAPVLAQTDPGPGRAQDRPPTRDADAVVGGCESRYSADLNSGEQAKAQRGYLMVTHCIRDAAVDQALALAGKDSRGRIEAGFERIEGGYKAVYRELNETPARDFYPTYAEALRDAYAEILRSVLKRRVLRSPM